MNVLSLVLSIRRSPNRQIKYINTLLSENDMIFRKLTCCNLACLNTRKPKFNVVSVLLLNTVTYRTCV